MIKQFSYFIGLILWTLCIWLWSGAIWYNVGLKEGRSHEKTYNKRTH